LRNRIASEILYRPIGIIHSPFKEPYGTPVQAASAQNVEGTVEVFPQYAEGLKDLEGFSHVILLYHFHLCRRFSLKVKPFLDDPLHGVFATRAPARPNSIGISVVQLIEVEKAELHIQDVDIVDGTPLLDIKPYVPEFDCRKADRIGWLEGSLDKLRKTTDDGRFVDTSSLSSPNSSPQPIRV
jgi:tRNA-Thr(GGU) m(6)t(6)A37 methyltransferase TsaA